MQMPITTATPSPAPAATSTASTKGTDNSRFNQTFNQTIAGTQGKETNEQSNGEASAPVNGVSNPSVTSLLGEQVSAADLLGAIEALIEKLGNADTQDLAQTTTESDLAEALQQLDMLLSSLAGIPALQQQPSAIVAEAVGQEQGQAAVVNLEELNALKSGMQEALVDLRALLKDQKSLPVNRDQMSQISKQLTSIDQLLSGKKPEQPAAAVAVPQQAAAVDTIDTVLALQTTPQASSHLKRMAHQLLHVGVLNVVQKPEKEAAETSLTELPEDSNDVILQPVLVNMDLQRQLAAVSKPVLAQPVPVQQFASTIQGMVVKQFNVSTVNGISQAQLTLYPEHLGQVNVNISVHNGALTASFVTDTVTAKDMLENQMAQLRSALQSQGLQVDKLVVSQTSVQPNLFQDRQGAQGQQQGSTKRDKSNDDTIGEIDFADMEEISVQQAADRDLGLGRGIHTIA
ncbi:flagellar hook-length control protein FliK [Paenibacillus sacheonensis]|uniref:Flagellar hook-length control protein-like C-terminal domain-containing protein n=1 Tax=Paenibacillus sacheonensis TaxID=742054 RepID=A0A7X4YMM1_9BACL|nr:flagellar hook-length control protein FliK [Paenibacillus sacheonensis]MBM7564613.1 flagellar hook-length control protein FliK [Paenibacillus sacheonensis]NBC69170.1 hypothetical protein [Paenibacillus sacheonensis]